MMEVIAKCGKSENTYKEGEWRNAFQHIRMFVVMVCWRKVQDASTLCNKIVENEVNMEKMFSISNHTNIFSTVQRPQILQQLKLLVIYFTSLFLCKTNISYY